MAVDYALKKPKKKKKSTYIFLIIAYLFVALAVCSSYSARGGSLSTIDLDIILKSISGLVHKEFFYGLKSINNIVAGTKLLLFTWYIHIIVVMLIIGAYIGKVEYAFKGVEQGSARWGTEEELKMFADPNGIPIAKDVFASLNPGVEINNVKQAAISNYNKVAIATTGGGKNESVLKPDIMQLNGNYFIIDPKASLYQDCGYLLKKNGYRVRVLNFYNFEFSHHWNPLAYVNSEIDVLNLGQNFMDATKEDAEKSDFWTGSAEDLFTSLILYVYKSDKEPIKSLERVVQIITGISYSERKISPFCEYSILMENYMADLINSGQKLDKVCLDYKSIRELPQETLGGIIANLKRRLSLWFTEVVSEVTAEDEMDFDSFANPNSKEAIFVTYPVGSTTFKAIITLFYQQFLDRMKYLSTQKCKGSLPVMLNLECDEICQLAKLRTLKDDVATIRSMNIRMTFICQSLTQLEAKYEKEARDILTNCGIICFLGTRDDKIKKWFCEEQIGYTTFKTQNKTYSKNGTSESEKETKRLLITADELVTLCKEDSNHNGKGVFLVGFERPFKISKIRADHFKNAEDVSFNWITERKERCFTNIEDEFIPIIEERKQRKKRESEEAEETLNEELRKEFEKSYSSSENIPLTDEEFFDELYANATESNKNDSTTKDKKPHKGIEAVIFDKDKIWESVNKELKKG